MNKKIKTFKKLEKILDKYREKGKKIVHCHGVFDLLHPGHIRHFQEAKKQGDRLVVTVTSDKFVNKGPGRPVFNQELRMESIAALSFVDYVVLNDNIDGIKAIKHVKPDIYVKGSDYKVAKEDITGKISLEKNAIEELGGKIYFTDDIVFSSSSLINQFLDRDFQEVQYFIKELKKSHSCDDIINSIQDLKGLKVLIIGDAIIDEYQYITLLGQTGKGNHLVGVNEKKENFLGGSLIIANHIAEFSDNVDLLTGLGKNCCNLDFIKEKLNKKIKLEAVFFDNEQTLVKKRYVMEDGNSLSKFFETYSSNKELLEKPQIDQVVKFIRNISNKYDLVLVCDFGNGFINKRIREEIDKYKGFLALTTQINSGNRGFNVISHYKKADYISLNEAELRLAAHDRKSEISKIAFNFLKKMHCKSINITRGSLGSVGFSSNKTSFKVPAFASSSFDRVGAGDSFFALSSLLQAKKQSLLLSNFIGAVAAALKIQFVGNKQAINKISLIKYIQRLCK